MSLLPPGPAPQPPPPPAAPAGACAPAEAAPPPPSPVNPAARQAGAPSPGAPDAPARTGDDPPPARDHRLPLGKSGEDVALTWLLARGYRLLERNYRFGRHGELDLVVTAPDGDLVFVEVKTGLSDAAGDPLSWVNGRKQHKIQRIAQAWCLERGIDMNRPMRFDAVAVHAAPNDEPVVVHVPHAFLPDGGGYWRGGGGVKYEI